MSRLLKCTRPVRFFNRDFEAGEEVDVDEFARAGGKDPSWLFAKMQRPMQQHGPTMYACFVSAQVDGGTARAEPDSTKGSEPLKAQEPKRGAEPPEAQEPDPEEAQPEDDEDDDEPEVSEWPKHSGGPWFELSNGERVKGKLEAIDAQAELDGEADNEED